MTSRYIAVDWGSTNFRAWLFEGERCLDSRQSAAGIARLNGQSPAAVLATQIHGWREGRTPVVMAGRTRPIYRFPPISRPLATS